MTVPTPKRSAKPPAKITGKNDTAPIKAFNNPQTLPLIDSAVSIWMVAFEGIKIKEIAKPMTAAIITTICRLVIVRNEGII